jgi:hypothetical protein
MVHQRPRPHMEEVDLCRREVHPLFIASDGTLDVEATGSERSLEAHTRDRTIYGETVEPTDNVGREAEDVAKVERIFISVRARIDDHPCASTTTARSARSARRGLEHAREVGAARDLVDLELDGSHARVPGAPPLATTRCIPVQIDL